MIAVLIELKGVQKIEKKQIFDLTNAKHGVYYKPCENPKEILPDDLR